MDVLLHACNGPAPGVLGTCIPDGSKAACTSLGPGGPAEPAQLVEQMSPGLSFDHHSSPPGLPDDDALISARKR